jgi:hypothetical protein
VLESNTAKGRTPAQRRGLPAPSPTFAGCSGKRANSNPADAHAVSVESVATDFSGRCPTNVGDPTSIGTHVNHEAWSESSQKMALATPRQRKERRKAREGVRRMSLRKHLHRSTKIGKAHLFGTGQCSSMFQLPPHIQDSQRRSTAYRQVERRTRCFSKSAS